MDFTKTERKWQRRWEDAGIFKTREGATKGKDRKKKCYVLEMLPYPSSTGLHMGHIRNYAMGDAFARFRRMQGFNVLYPMGYDAFGLPAENAAIKNKAHPKEYTEKAIAGIRRNQKALGLSYDWSRELATCYPEYYKWNQWIFLKMLKKGLAYKKEAPVNWCPKCETVLANEQVSEGVCWRCGSEAAIKNLNQWFLKITKYADKLLANIDKLEGWPNQIRAMQRNWIGKKPGYTQFYKVNGTDITLSTFTTHHHTSFAEIFIAIAPEHPLAMKLVAGSDYEKGARKFIDDVMKKKIGGKFTPESAKEGYFTGKYAKDFCSGRDLPIYIADFALMDFGTGIVKASAHDQRDFDFAKAHDIELVEVLFPNKLIDKSGSGVEYDIVHPGLDKSTMRDYTFGGPYKDVVIGNLSIADSGKEAYIEIGVRNGIDHRDLQEVSAIRQIVYLLFHKRGKERIFLTYENMAAQMEDIELMGFVWSNGKFVLEKGNEKVPFSYDGQGYMFRSDQFTGMPVPEARTKMGEWMVKKKYAKKSVAYGIRDWGISRQRYWGTPIPVVYCGKCGIVPVPEKDLPVVLPTDVKFTGHGNPLAGHDEFVKTKCPKCGGPGSRETDTMDTFMDSSWYFLRYCSPDSEQMFGRKAVDYWMPVDQYIGGAEHAVMHLLYARFFSMVLKDLGLVGFEEPFTRLFNQGIVYKDGHKMSKSFGNVVTQEQIAKKYGTDAARMFLLFVASPDSQLEWSDKGIVGTHKFLFRLHRLVDDIIADAKSEKKAKGKEEGKYRSGKLETRDRQMTAKLHSTIKAVTAELEGLGFNKAISALMGFTNSLTKYAEDPDKNVINECVGNLLVMLSPFAPHTCEELWERLGRNEAGKNFVSVQKWPKADEKLIDPKLEMMEQLAGQTTDDIREIIKLVGKKPKEIFIYVSPLWKYEVYRTIIKGSGKGKTIKDIMKNPGIRKEGKSAVHFAERLANEAGRLGNILGQADELLALNEAQPGFEKEFSCKVTVMKAEEKRNERSLKAEPGKPGIELV